MRKVLIPHKPEVEGSSPSLDTIHQLYQNSSSSLSFNFAVFPKSHAPFSQLYDLFLKDLSKVCFLDTT
jgi:hypothetical protein